MGKRKRVSTVKTESKETIIPEDEQWRIINESGVLQGLKRPSQVSIDQDSADERSAAAYTPDDSEEEVEEHPSEQDEDTPELIFDAILLIVPLCFLYAMMDVSVSQPTLHSAPPKTNWSS